MSGYPTIPLRSQYLNQNVEESQSKKSYDARMNFKHVRRGPRSHTTSKKSYTEKSYDDRGKYYLGIKHFSKFDNIKKMQIGSDQEMAQSEKNPTP